MLYSAVTATLHHKLRVSGASQGAGPILAVSEGLRRVLSSSPVLLFIGFGQVA